jgi:signal transduction histidine kinase
MKLSLNIKTRLSLWYLLIIAAVLVFFSLFTYFLLSRSLYDIARAPSILTAFQPLAVSKGNTHTADSPDPVLLSSYLISPEWLEQLKQKSTSVISVYSSRGQITLDQKEFITGDMQGEQQVQLFLRSRPGDAASYEVLAIIQPVSEVNATLAAYQKVLYFVIPATAMFAACCGFLLIWRMLKPVKAIARTAHDIQEKDLSRRIEIKNNDELGQLAATLNQTFEHLEKAIQRERQFTSDASHELRTSLSIMQSEATLTLKKDRSNEEYRKPLAFISEEIAHMASVINKLLMLTRMDNGKEILNFAPVDLSLLLAGLAEDIEVLCEEKSLLFNTDLLPEIKINGDEVKLKELFLNLLDNAIKFTPPHGSIGLSLKKDREIAVIVIRDNGIGISEDHLPHIFERFYRIVKTPGLNNNGSGLGLAICKYIVELHKGHIEVKSQPGKGSSFTVRLPVVTQFH